MTSSLTMSIRQMATTLSKTCSKRSYTYLSKLELKSKLRLCRAEKEVKVEVVIEVKLQKLKQ